MCGRHPLCPPRGARGADREGHPVRPLQGHLRALHPGGSCRHDRPPGPAPTHRGRRRGPGHRRHLHALWLDLGAARCGGRSVRAARRKHPPSDPRSDHPPAGRRDPRRRPAHGSDGRRAFRLGWTGERSRDAEALRRAPEAGRPTGGGGRRPRLQPRAAGWGSGAPSEESALGLPDVLPRSADAPRLRDLADLVLDGHNAYAFPNEHGITAVAAMPTKELLPEFRRDREKAYFRFIEALPDAPRCATPNPPPSCWANST